MSGWSGLSGPQFSTLSRSKSTTERAPDVYDKRNVGEVLWPCYRAALEAEANRASEEERGGDLEFRLFPSLCFSFVESE